MLTEVLKAFITLFVIMDPFAAVPMFLGLTKGLPRREVKENVINAISVAAAVLFLFLFFGLSILNLFNIGVNSFIIAGGIVLLILGIQAVLGIKFRKERVADYDVASVPLGTPLITGPGVITAVMIIVNEFGYAVAMVAAVASLLLMWSFLFFSSKIHKAIGEHWSRVLSRVMGLLVSAIAVEFIRRGMNGILGGV
ncbi:MarC family protein [Candidatus Woesearchaeota archaeon]|nr:MarC family protein [Candidatus Woesearchaeota archaeon]